MSLAAGLFFGMTASLVPTPMCYAIVADKCDVSNLESSKTTQSHDAEGIR
jgi:hypothetical protein